MLSQKHPNCQQLKLPFKIDPYTFKRKNDHASKNRRKLVAFTTTKGNFIQQETSLETPVISNNDRPTVPDGSLTIKRLYKTIILKAVTNKSNSLLGKTAKNKSFLTRYKRLWIHRQFIVVSSSVLPQIVLLISASLSGNTPISASSCNLHRVSTLPIHLETDDERQAVGW